MPWPAVGAEPVVEEQRGAGLPGLLLAAHHQLPILRELRQWTRRSSSPRRYSRP
jgi:hypothetical protein